MPLEAALALHTELPAVGRKVAGEFVVHAPDELPCESEDEGLGAGGRKASGNTDVRAGLSTQPLEELCQGYHRSRRKSDVSGGK